MRPCWIVLAPGTAKKLEPAILRVAARDPRNGCPWAIVDGKQGYVAIVEAEPGSRCVNDDKLAKALTTKPKKPGYLLWFDDELPRVKAFVGGKLKGEVKASPDEVLFTLGFRFDWMWRAKKVALRLETPMVNAKRGEAMIGNWSVSQWQQMMRRDHHWHVLLEGVGPATLDQVFAICADANAQVRFLGASMIAHIGYHGLNMEERLQRGLATLAKLAEDRSTKVRDVAIKARDNMVGAASTKGAIRRRRTVAGRVAKICHVAREPDGPGPIRPDEDPS